MGELAAKLKEARVARGLSQRAAAIAVGISHGRLRDFEKGTTSDGKYEAIPKRDVLERICG